MSKKIDRATRGPSWAEVILGAALSFVLGVVLGAVLLIARPVLRVPELPKPEDRVRGAVYYVEGAMGGNARAALAKRKAFVEGQSITATEAEINALVVPAAPAAAPTKAGEKPAEPAPAAAEGLLAPGQPNVRIREGILQVGLPVTVNFLGLSPKVILQARGDFDKTSDGYVYAPDEIYLGSCPIQRVPLLAGFIQRKLLSQQAIPEDILTAWRKLTSVQIEGNVLKLSQ